MSEGRKPDPRRRKASTPRATHLSVPNGGKANGYKAGEIYGCYGHYVGNHKPCLHDLTSGELSCPYCEANKSPEWRGYVPVWDQDFTLRYVLITEDYHESVDMIPHRGQMVMVRDRAKYSPLIVRSAEGVMIRQLPDKRPWLEPIDMYAICRCLWKETALDAWYAITQTRDTGRSDGASPLNVKDMNPMIQKAAERANQMGATAAKNQATVDEWRKTLSVPEPSRNGKHKKGGEADG